MAKQRLVEHTIARPNEIRTINLEESVNKKIMVEGKEIEALGAYTFPISRPGQKNLNGRIYSHGLWESVIQKQGTMSAYGLTDHPKDGEGSVRDAWCVWRNLRFNEDRTLVLADAYLFGTWGRHALEAIRAGGEIGLSTSGWGELEEDGVSVADNYELERHADWVLNPSYSVFGNSGHEMESVEKPLPASIEGSLTIEEVNESTATSGKDLKENVMQNNRLNEAMVKLNIQGLIKEAEGQGTVRDRLAALKEIQPFAEEAQIAEVQTALQEKIAAAEAELSELAEKGIEADEIKAQYEESSEKLSALNEEVASLKEQNEQLQTEKVEIQEKLDSALELIEGKQTQLAEAEAEKIKLQALANIKVDASIHAETIDEFDKLETAYREAQETIAELEKQLAEKTEAPTEESDEKVEENEHKARRKEAVKAAAKKRREEKAAKKVEEERANLAPRKVEEGEIAPGQYEDVFNYFLERVEEDNRWLKHKEAILGCKTLKEAQIKVLRIDLDADSRRHPAKKVEKVEKPESKEIVEESYGSGVSQVLKTYEGWV